MRSPKVVIVEEVELAAVEDGNGLAIEVDVVGLGHAGGVGFFQKQAATTVFVERADCAREGFDRPLAEAVVGVGGEC